MNWAEHNLVQNGDVVSIAQWKEFDWLAQGFSLAKAGNIDHRFGDVVQARQRVAKILDADASNWTSMQQIHGSHIEDVSRDDIGAGLHNYESGFADTDGLITSEKGALLSVAVADCVPLLFVDPVKRQVAVAHAGRRGTFAGIAQKMFREMSEHGSRARDVQIVIGPSIGPCCYAFDDKPLDLWSINEEQLREAGAQIIIRTDICTKHTNYFFSHQRDPQAGRFAGLIGIT
jgi:hypothetical protein